MTHVPDSEELSRRLGEHYTLDGSFASLWAIERILQAVRRVPECAEHVSWIAPYLCDLFERAFLEMEMTLTRVSPTALHVTAPISYKFDVAHDLNLLIYPPKLMPAFHGIMWMGSELLGTACVPWYGLSTIFQNNSWAQTDHDMIGNQRDRMDRAVPWLTKEYVRALDLPAEHHDLAHALSRHMAWPPLGYPQNDYGGHNLPRLRDVLKDADPQSSRTVLDAFVASQDRACQVLAAAASIDVGIPPDIRHEAHIYQGVIHHGSQLAPSPFILKAIDSLLVSLETPNVDAAHPEYASVMTSPPEQGLAIARRVLEREPNLPTFHCSAGWHQETLGRRDAALTLYSRAIELKPDYAQAFMNRGSLRSMMGDYELAAQDFYRVRELTPEGYDVAMNLLVNYFMSRQQKPKDPPASQELPALRRLLVQYGAKKIALHAAMRAMMSHDNYLVPSTYLPTEEVHARGIHFSATQSFPKDELWVFTDRAAADRAQAKHGTLGLYSSHQSARKVVEASLRHSCLLIRVNPCGPESEGFLFTYKALPLLFVWLSGLEVERAALKGGDLQEKFHAHKGWLVAVKQGNLLLTSEGTTAHIAAAIDHSEQMCAELGQGTIAAPMPAANLAQTLRQASVSHIKIAGISRVFPIQDVLG